jgi:uncharacterized membrane protein YeaQ/YmgE (transglycosylase-associated protein family)
MSAGLEQFLKSLVEIVVVLAIGAFVSFIFYSLKRRELFGGYIGGMVIGVIGALIGGFVLNHITLVIIDFLARNKYVNVNVISGFIGAYFALFIMNKLNHNRERKKF